MRFSPISVILDPGDINNVRVIAAEGAWLCVSDVWFHILHLPEEGRTRIDDLYQLRDLADTMAEKIATAIAIEDARLERQVAAVAGLNQMCTGQEGDL